MSAERKNIVNRDRVDLHAVLPLETPFSLFIDVCNACNFKCKFCAIQTENIRKFEKKAMPWELFKKIIDDLKEFPVPLKMLRLAANGEPLINKELPKMIAYAKKEMVAEHIEIVTNASLLTPKLSDNLIDAGLDRIRISIEALDADGYEAICGFKINWEKIVNNLAYFYGHRKQCEVYIKTVDASIKNEEQLELFYKIFENICDKIFIEHVIPIWADYNKIYDNFDIEREEGLHGDKIREVSICPFPFYSFVINPDGIVTVCCSDWKREITVGNVLEEKVTDIWRGEKYAKFLLKMIREGRKNCVTCSACEYPMFDAVDNLDKYKVELLKKFMSKN